MTIAGGQVLVPHPRRIPRPSPQDLDQLQLLTSPNPLRRAAASMYFCAAADWQPHQLIRDAGVHDVAQVYQQLIGSKQLEEVVVSPSRTLRVHPLMLDRLSQRIQAVLKAGHDKEPLRSLLDRGRVASQLRLLADEAIIQVVLSRLGAAGRIRLTEQGVGLADHGPRLSPNESKLLAQLIQRYREAGFQPPSVTECVELAAKNRHAVPSLIALAAAEGQLVPINSDVLLHADAHRRMRQLLGERMAGGQGLTVSQIREILDTSRKYAVPFCEYLDRTGFTRREGDLRFLAEKNETASAIHT